MLWVSWGLPGTMTFPCSRAALSPSNPERSVRASEGAVLPLVSKRSENFHRTLLSRAGQQLALFDKIVRERGDIEPFSHFERSEKRLVKCVFGCISRCLRTKL